MENARLEESQAGIKIAGKNISLSPQSLSHVRLFVTPGFPDPITSWQIEREKSGNSNRFHFLGFQNYCT